MERYNVVIAASARNDMDEIYEYIFYELSAPIAAVNQYERIATAILSLDIFPERIKIIDSEYGANIKLRQM